MCDSVQGLQGWKAWQNLEVKLAVAEAEAEETEEDRQKK